MSIASSQAGSNANSPRRLITTFNGDGTTEDFTIVHNFGSDDLIVSVREVSDSLREVFLDNYPDPSDPMNKIIISFGFAPTALQSYKVIVVG